MATCPSEASDAPLSSSRPQQTKPHFLDLPAEIRNQIYELVVISKGIIGYARPPNIAQVSQQVRRESLPIFYSNNIFNVQSASSLNAWIPSISEPNRHLIRHVTCHGTAFRGLPHTESGYPWTSLFLIANAENGVLEIRADRSLAGKARSTVENLVRNAVDGAMKVGDNEAVSRVWDGLALLMVAGPLCDGFTKLLKRESISCAELCDQPMPWGTTFRQFCQDGPLLFSTADFAASPGFSLKPHV
jgi:hypothetical protein